MAAVTAMNKSANLANLDRNDAAAPAVSPNATSAGLLAAFCSTRQQTEWICSHLEIEDHVVQPAAFVSPPKWHLAHTTWFFDRFVLQAADEPGERIAGCNLLFNSYYKSQGSHWLQGNRGHLSRPTVREVMDYRHEVDACMMRALEAGAMDERLLDILALGIQHEKQHQELLLMDIKFIYASHPFPLPYDSISSPSAQLPAPPPLDWLVFAGKICGFGAEKGGFAWDNERPRHRRLLPEFQLATRLVTNGEYLAFMQDGGYQRPELWLSDGWDWVCQNGISCPLYWQPAGGAAPDRSAIAPAFLEYHPGGLQPMHPHLPVSHVSLYEADAYARWRRARLPTEFELENFLAATAAQTSPSDAAGWQPERAICPLPSRAADSNGNGLLWQWTQSPYMSYPGFEPERGDLGEYNGKFMCNQFVLRGGCVATPLDHLRTSYRNFYRASDRWCFSGIRLAKDL